MRNIVRACVLLLLFQGSAAAQSTPCVTAPDVSAILDHLLVALNSGSANTLGELVGMHWDSQRFPMGTGPLVTALNRWHWRSPHLERAAVCAVTATSGYALLRNPSRELD